MSESPDILARLDELERRINSLEAVTYKRGVLARAIWSVIEKWPGPFTGQQIRKAVQEFHPGALPAKDYSQVENYIGKLEKQSRVIRIQQGKGRNGSVFTKASSPPSGAGKTGSKLNSRRSYESGFRALVRCALGDLPKQFTLYDLRRWFAENKPGVQIPSGSWSSTLYKLQQRDELIVVKNSHSVKHKVYARGPVRIGPSGDEMKQLEKNWEDFKVEMEREKQNAEGRA